MEKLRVKEILKAKGISQKKLAELIGVAEISLSRSINGNPSLETLDKIATALQVPISEIFKPNEGFTALIDNNGTLYRANSIEELERLITQIKGGL